MDTYVEKIAQKHRLKKLGLDDVIGYCFTQDTTSVIPILKDSKIVSVV
jgi:phosphosulfolactate phosphohydrolase-like enzyme